jgi:hypothetical protein
MAVCLNIHLRKAKDAPKISSLCQHHQQVSGNYTSQSCWRWPSRRTHLSVIHQVARLIDTRVLLVQEKENSAQGQGWPVKMEEPQVAWHSGREPRVCEKGPLPTLSIMPRQQKAIW